MKSVSCLLFISFFFDVGSMELPGISFSQNEGKALAEYHRTVGDGKTYFMPRTENELNALYDLYKSGQIESSVVSPIKHLWWSISGNIQDEFYYRCLDGNKSVIDEYLARFRSFIKITDDFHDRSFLEILYSGGAGSLNDILSLFIMGVERKINASSELTRESTCLPYTVSEIDKILNASPNFQDIKLAEYYRTCYLTGEFYNSPEYWAIRDAVMRTFQEGVSIPDFGSKE